MVWYAMVKLVSFLLLASLHILSSDNATKEHSQPSAAAAISDVCSIGELDTNTKCRSF